MCYWSDCKSSYPLICVDGEPEVAIHHFNKQNSDAMFRATNAPCRSTYNRVERRMTPLNNDLRGIILPHDHYSNHLKEKEKQFMSWNFFGVCWENLGYNMGRFRDW